MNVPRISFPRPPRHAMVAAGVVLGLIVVVVLCAVLVRTAYTERIVPHVRVGNIALGGHTREEALQTLQDAYDAMLDNGLDVDVNGVRTSIPLRVASGDIAYSLIDIDVSAEIARAYALGRADNVIADLFLPLAYALGVNADLTPQLVVNESMLTEAIIAAYPDVEDPGTPTGFAITIDRDGNPTIAATASSDGTAFDFPTAFTILTEDAEDLRLTPLVIPVETLASSITVSDAERLFDNVEAALTAAPYVLSYTPENATEARTWEVTKDALAEAILPTRNDDGALALTLEATAMAPLLTELHDDIDVAAQNARFAMESTRVVEFAASHDGVTVNDDATIEALTAFLGTENAEIMVAVDRVAPSVTTENVNTLGIREILGVGTSDFKGSPANRIANITHGAEKLNGLLIAPGEIVSLLEQLRPFTVADGYLPELVIKGDEIKPEVGGGLCQIGTTTFRAVMNSGLKVVERRNHSLVVSYYNDPANGNPGTDATIYDPSPDFKFQNDTANYILLTTEVDLTNKKLFFTFWGTSDGRQGSYEPPTVLSWSGYGATQYKETDSLAAGVEQCQSPHPGATTTFTYTVTYGDGTAYEEEFFSSYRSLAKICLVGKADAASEATEDADETAVIPEENAEETTAVPN